MQPFVNGLVVKRVSLGLRYLTLVLHYHSGSSTDFRNIFKWVGSKFLIKILLPVAVAFGLRYVKNLRDRVHLLA